MPILFQLACLREFCGSAQIALGERCAKHMQSSYVRAPVLCYCSVTYCSMMASTGAVLRGPLDAVGRRRGFTRCVNRQEVQQAQLG